MAKYGDNHLYDSGAIYGRITPTFLAAQESHHRQTALRVVVKDERLNLWELVSGAHAYEDGIGAAYAAVNGAYRSWDIEFWAFRGWHEMALLPNGTIVRTRVGNPANLNDRQIWVQEVTDPDDLPQWENWSVLYSGTHYGNAGIVVTGAGTYDIVHFKGDGNIYLNNSVHHDFDAAEGDDWEPLLWNGIADRDGAGWIAALYRDIALDGRRTVDNFYVEDVTDPGMDSDWDRQNYSWMRGGLVGINLSGNTIGRIGAFQLHFNPRDGDHGVAVHYCEQTTDGENRLTPPYIIRGIGGGAGSNYIIGLRLRLLSDGYYYLNAIEVHHDEEGEAVTPLGMGMPIWMRSKNLKHWSDPVIGPPLENTGSLSPFIEKDGYVYWADSEVVYRRPIGTISYDISNYVPTLEFDLPRDNQPGTGKADVANPDGINNYLKDLNDREIQIEVGLKTETGEYEYSQFDRFWIQRQNKEIQGAVNRLHLDFGDIWARLDTSLRDVTNHVGQTIWDDWSPGARNKAFNYFFATDTAPVETADSRLTTRGTCLWTAWKGHNMDLSVHFSDFTGNPYIITRYQDAQNFMFWEYDTPDLFLRSLVDGQILTVDSVTVGSDSTPTIRIRQTWHFYEAWFNGTKVMDDAYADDHFVRGQTPLVQPGYAGFAASSGLYTISNFHFEDWESALTSEDLIKVALAAGDFHDIIVGGADSRIFAIVWGPQTDAETLAAALAQSLEIDKLQLIWRNGSVEVGKFNNETPKKTIRNEVVKSEEIDEANRRINLAVVDGNEDFWLEVDTADTVIRGRQITSYFDVPELLDRDDVIARAKEEIKRGAQGASPGGTTPLFFDLWRMDAVTWVDPAGNEKLVRIEGFSVEIDQSKKPHQRQTFDTSEYPSETTAALNRPAPTAGGIGVVD